MFINYLSWNPFGSSDSVCTCAHGMNIQHGLRFVLLRILRVCTFDVHKCRIAVFETENCPKQEYCIMYVKPLLTCNAFTQLEHLGN